MDIKFGTDGWRGVMARDFTFDNVRKVAQAVAEYVKALPPKSRGKGAVIIGFDRRFQSEAFAVEIARVMQGNKLQPVVMEESLPTPAVSYLTHKEGALGLMVTASHNPPAYNGVKIKVGGRAATEDVTRAVESLLGAVPPVRADEAPRKSYRKAYLDWLRSRIACGPLARIRRPVVVDYLYGCASGLLEELVRSKRIIALHDRRDPLFGGLNPEPIEKNLGELMERVRRERALLGIALDGDADRVGIVDDAGRYLTPCQVFPMLCEYLITVKGIKGKVAQSVSMGALAERVAKAHRLPFEEVPVGFKHVAERLASGAAAIGGEESGGYAWKGGQPERDGLLTSLLFLEMCHNRRMTPSQLWGEIEKKYGKSCFQRVDFHLHKPVTDKRLFAERVRKRLPKKVLNLPISRIVEIDGVKVVLEGGAWVLMRPSGTEPLLRTYAESDSPAKTKDLLELARKWTHAS